jgi:hypothetical protein
MPTYIVFVINRALEPSPSQEPQTTWAMIDAADTPDMAVQEVVALGLLPKSDSVYAVDITAEETMQGYDVTHQVTVTPKPPPGMPPDEVTLPPDETGRRLDSVDPATGPEAGETEITLSGAGFTGIGGVRFEGPSGTAWAASFDVLDDQTMTCPTPPGTGVVDVIAFDGDPGDAVLPGGFTYT